MRLHRAEACNRLKLADVRALVEPGAVVAALADGTALALRWGECRGCYGGKLGRALLLACPICSRSARVLWRPPSCGWGCCKCWPLSYASHRRSGSRQGKPKPLSWHRDQLQQEQLKCVGLLGLAQWPPQRLLWDAIDLRLARRCTDAHRISRSREAALIARIDALESLRIAAACRSATLLLQSIGSAAVVDIPKALDNQAQVVLNATKWATRRGPVDVRSSRQSLQMKSRLIS